MLIIILIILAIIAILFVIFKHDENSLFVVGLYGSSIAMFSGIIIYTAKIGGLSDTQKIFLFMSPGIKTWFQYMDITLDRLGYLIAVGRYLFPTFLLFIAMNYSMIPFIRKHKVSLNFLAVPALVFLILYYPRIFYVLARNRFVFQSILMKAAVVWIILYLAVSIFLLVYEYISITMIYYSKQFRYVLMSYISLALLYVLYCFQDPIQVYQLYSAEYMWTAGLSYANPALTLFEWVILSTGTILFVTLGFWNSIGYTQLNIEAGKVDVSLQRKFDTASRGISVFVHSMKNQLLSARVIHKKIDQILVGENPDLHVLRTHTDMMCQINEGMLLRMEELYRSIKTNYIVLRPVPVGEIVESAVNRFHQKYPDVSVLITMNKDVAILADRDHLSEAVNNLLLNAQDAIAVAGREADERVELIVHEERLYTVLEVKDNGIGIPKNVRTKIFDPFYTSKNTNSNWGMGLYYVKQIVKSHLGSLRWESTPNVGTSFLVMLPRYHKSGRLASKGLRGRL